MMRNHSLTASSGNKPIRVAREVPLVLKFAVHAGTDAFKIVPKVHHPTQSLYYHLVLADRFNGIHVDVKV